MQNANSEAARSDPTRSKPSTMAWGTTLASAMQAPEPPAGGLAAIMSEQLAEKITLPDSHAPRADGSDAGADSDPGDADLRLALELSRAEAEGAAKAADAADTAPAHNESDDLALALQLQEEEEAALDAFQSRHARQQQQNAGHVVLRSRFRPPEEHARAQQARDAAAQRRLYTADDADELMAEMQSLREALAAAAAAAASADTSGAAGAGGWRRDRSLRGQGGDGDIVTKHDAAQNGERNWRRLEEDVGAMGRVSSGAGGRQQHALSNRVFNSLRHGLRKQTQAAKGMGATVERDAKQTYSKGLDHRTRLTLHRLVNSGLLREVNGIVRTGKEAVVYQAFGTFDSADAPRAAAGAGADSNTGAGADDTDGDGDADVGSDGGGDDAQQLQQQEQDTELSEKERVQLSSFAVKVFKTTLNEFKNRMDYVRGDYRFATVQELSHQNPRKVVRVWAEKEMRNLSRARRAGLPCPYPVRLVKNVLVMEFIGEDGWAAPQLREAQLSPRRAENCYAQVTAIMHGLATLCGLVHADLSEYNLLYLRGKCVLIDVGQAVLLDHPRARAFLLSDCENVTRFFAARGVEHLLEPRALCELLLDAAEADAHEGRAGSYAAACDRWVARVSRFVRKNGSGGDGSAGAAAEQDKRDEPTSRAVQQADMLE